MGSRLTPTPPTRLWQSSTAEGLLEVLPGIGTSVAALPSSTAAERKRLLGGEVQRLVVEAKKIGVELDDLLAAVTEHWQALRYRESEEEFAPL